MPNRSKLLTTLLIACFALAAACKKDQSATGADAKKTIGLYATGFNALLADPKRLIAGYFSSLPGDKAPDFERKPSLSDAGFATSKLKEAREAFASAHEAAPESLASLQPIADATLAAADKAITTYTEAYRYYEAETFKDDKGVKGKQLHEQMIAASDAFDAAMSKLSDGMDAIEDAQTTDEIKKYASDKDYSYWFRFYSHEVKRFVVAVSRASTPEDVAKLPALAKALAPVDADLAAFVTKKGAAISSTFKTYADDAVTFQSETKTLMRLLEAGKTFADTEVDQAAEAVVRAFNGLINMGNALIQVEAAGTLKDE